MSVLTTTCPNCGTGVQLPLSSLLLAQVPGDEVPGRLAFVCVVCNDLVGRFVSLPVLAGLAAAGCPAIVASAQTPYPEHRPDGPALSVDDLIDLYDDLGRDDWSAALTEEQR